MATFVTRETSHQTLAPALSLSLNSPLFRMKAPHLSLYLVLAAGAGGVTYLSSERGRIQDDAQNLAALLALQLQQ